MPRLEFLPLKGIGGRDDVADADAVVKEGDEDTTGVDVELDEGVISTDVELDVETPF